MNVKVGLLHTLLFAAGSSFWICAGAHHAASANFTEEIGTLEGEVIEIFWNNPHVNYYLEVSESDGSTRTWILESHNLTTMARVGWSRDTVKEGDRIRISGNLGRDGKPRLLIVDQQLMDTLEILE